jgi:hypothetical protein
MEVNIDTTILALPKGSSTLRIRAKLEEARITKIEERIGCEVVTPGENKEFRLP